MKIFPAVAASLPLLAACGGGDEVVLINGAAPPAGPPAYRALFFEATDLFAKLDDYEVRNIVEIPPSSDTTFDGILVVFDDVDENFGGYVGDFSAVYTFATETIDGEASGFFFDNNPDETVPGFGTPVSGTVTVDGNTISAGVIPVTFGGTLDGSTVSGSGNSTFAGPDGDMFVAFGENVSAVGRSTMVVTVIAD